MCKSDACITSRGRFAEESVFCRWHFGDCRETFNLSECFKWVAAAASPMLRHSRHSTRRFTENRWTRHIDVWVLCALLLFLAISARLASYEIHKHTLRPATTHAYVTIEQVRRELSKSRPLVLWLACILTLAVVVKTRAILAPVAVARSIAFTGFNPESHLRPPPLR